MSIFTDALNFIEQEEKKLQSFFTSEHINIQSLINDAQAAGSLAIAITAVTAPQATTEVTNVVNKVTNTLNLASGVVNTLSTAETLTATTSALTTAASELSSTGIIGSKAQASINVLSTKVNGVAAAISKLSPTVS